MMTSLLAGTLLATSLAVPALASAQPLAPHMLETLAAAPEFNWDDIESVPDYLDRIEREQRLKRLERARRIAKSNQGSSVPVITEDSNTVWSTERIDSIAREALKYYGIPESEWAWVLAANQKVAFRESRNRPGAISASGTFQGMHQWSPSWGGAERLDGEWSIRRFVKAYDDGGKANIRRHWKSTIGSL